MNTQLEKYFKELNYELILSNESDFEDEVQSGKLRFIDYGENNTSFLVVTIDFCIFESTELDDFLYKADCISSDLEYVACSYCNYVEHNHLFGNCCIIDDVKLEQEKIDKLELVKCVIGRLSRIFSTLGIALILVQSKSIILDCSIKERRDLLQSVLELGFIPIDENLGDVVIGKYLF